MSEFKNRVIWITGASSGIGEALATEVAQQGPSILLLSAPAAFLPELEEVAGRCRQTGVTTHTIPFDLASSKEIRLAYEKAKEISPVIDMMFHNGGISQRSLVEETPLDIDRKLFEVNFWGAVELTKLILPGMLEQVRGHFASSASIAGLFGFRYRSAYAAS